MIDTRGLTPGQVLAALYNGSRAQGLGVIHDNPFNNMTEAEAEQIIESATQPTGRVYFDYLMGRVLKVDLTDPDEFDPRLYDRDLGQGHAYEVIQALRQKVGAA